MPKVTIKNSQGDDQGTFQSDSSQSVGTQAQEEGVPIPFSCGVGACRTCVCTVNKGMEHIDQEAVGPKHIETEDNEILSCISGVKPDAPDDAEIEIQAENL